MQVSWRSPSGCRSREWRPSTIGTSEPCDHATSTPSSCSRAEVMAKLEIVPRGPFNLAAAMDFAGGFPAGIGGGGVGVASISLAFPLEGTDESVALELWQDADGVVRGRTDASA